MNILRALLLSRSIFMLILFLSGTISVKAQDIQYSQFYNVPMYQNPAFAGSTHAVRISGHQRLQWPSLDARYITSQVAVDHFFSNYNSGFGLMFQKDMQGAKNISSTEIHGLYSYELPVSRQVSMRAGLDLGYVSRFTNYNVTVPQQFNNNGQIPGAINPYADYPDKKSYVDVGAGGLVYTKQWWGGISAHHLNVPNQSPLKSVPSRLPVKFALTGGYKIPLIHKKYMAYMEDETDISLTPTFHYKSQGKSDQLDFGAYVRYSEILFGIWYRGIPVKHYKKSDGQRLQNNESFVAMVGWKYQSISITYSYDIVISRLGRYNPGGSHELNVTWVHHKHKKKHKQMKRLPCPSFH